MGERARTQISSVGAEATGQKTVEVILENEGDTKLADFDQWDVIVQYDTNDDGDHDVVEWLSYGSTQEMLRGGEWGNSDGDAIGDIFEPKIFNPGEVMTITLVISSSVEISSTGVAIIGTPNGITASKDFTR